MWEREYLNRMNESTKSDKKMALSGAETAVHEQQWALRLGVVAHIVAASAVRWHSVAVAATTGRNREP